MYSMYYPSGRHVWHTFYRNQYLQVAQVLLTALYRVLTQPRCLARDTPDYGQINGQYSSGTLPVSDFANHLCKAIKGTPNQRAADWLQVQRRTSDVPVTRISMWRASADIPRDIHPSMFPSADIHQTVQQQPAPNLNNKSNLFFHDTHHGF